MQTVQHGSNTEEHLSCGSSPSYWERIHYDFKTHTLQLVLFDIRGQPKVEISLLAETQSRLKVTQHIWQKPHVPPKVQGDFRPKKETESQ